MDAIVPNTEIDTSVLPENDSFVSVKRNSKHSGRFSNEPEENYS